MILKQNSRIILSERRTVDFLDGKKLSKYSITHHDGGEHTTQQIGSLHIFKETTLGPQNKEQLSFEGDMQLLIVPLVGHILVTNARNQNVVDVGEALMMSVKANESFMLFNDFENSDVHYIVAGFSSNEPVEGITRFSLSTNKLVTLFGDVSQRGLMRAVIGQWNGRSEGEFTKSASNSFAWVLQGAFEIENCLLEKGDALAMQGKEKIEFEALSNDAIIILLEMA